MTEATLDVFRAPPLSLSSYDEPDPLWSLREMLLQERRRSFAAPGCYLDRSATGAGKTRADFRFLKELIEQTEFRGIVAVRSHKSAGELVHEFRHRRRMPVLAHVPRTTTKLKQPIVCPFCGICPPGPPEPDCEHCHGLGEIHGFQSCWNPEADRAERNGFSVTATVCLACKLKDICRERGYLRHNELASGAKISVVTHARLEMRGFASASDGFRYVSIQEDPIKILCPQREIPADALLVFDRILHLMLTDPHSLNYLGEIEDSGKGAVYSFLKQMALVSQLVLEQAIGESAPLKVIGLPIGIPMPPRLQTIIWKYADRHALPMPGCEVFRILAAAASTGLRSLVLVRPDEIKAPGRSHEERFQHMAPTETRRRFPGLNLLATFRNPPPDNATIWFSDATMRQSHLEAAIGRPLKRVIQPKPMPRRQRVVQVLRDIRRGTSARIVICCLRKGLAEFPDAIRIGIICHQLHKNAIRALEAELAPRKLIIDHFGSDADRGSNDWHRNCDLLVVLGTPRIPKKAIVDRLLALGQIEAAMLKGTWGKDVTVATLEAGGEAELRYSRYAEQPWQEVHESLVRAALRQAVGRARSESRDGIPAIVFSNEPLGLPCVPLKRVGGISDGSEWLIRQFCALISNKYTLEKSAQNAPQLAGGNSRRKQTQQRIKTNELLTWINRSPIEKPRKKRWLNLRLRELESAGIVRRIGKQSGWWIDDWQERLDWSNADSFVAIHGTK